jgi:hypothetical protein
MGKWVELPAACVRDDATEPASSDSFVAVRDRDIGWLCGWL